MALFIGTSGYSYRDWVGPVYPPGTRSRDYLAGYPRALNAVELNFSYYRIPTPAVIRGILDQAGGRLAFTAKLHQVFTHGRDPSSADRIGFREGLEPMVQAGVLGCVLAQFPYSFHATRGNLRYLGELIRSLSWTRTVVEVRHESWLHPGFFSWLGDHGAGFCNVDQPALPGLLPLTDHVVSNIGYLRLHGRNQDRWWEHEHAYERYDYLYSEQELKLLASSVSRLQEKAEQVFVFFNNHFKGKAVDNALHLDRILSPAEPIKLG